MTRMCTRRRWLRQAGGTLAAAALAGTPAGAAAAVEEFERGGMIYRRLGQTDLFVSLLSLGSHTDPAFKIRLKDHNILNEEGQRRRDRLVAQALDRGVNVIDTYESEGQWEPVARVVRPRRDKVLVSICRQFPMFVGKNIEMAARLYGHVDLYRIYLGDGPRVDQKILEDWDVMRKAKAAGKVRAIGISTHSERMMVSALDELEGLDYVLFPYNFIHARADYSQFLPAAIGKGVGLVAMKPLAAGSIARLDPRAGSASAPENERIQLYQARNRTIHPAVVQELTRTLDRLPEETLCQAALRFVYSRPFLSCTIPGIFGEELLEQNYAAMRRYREFGRREAAALGAVRDLLGGRTGWLPRPYGWLRGWSA